MTEQVSSEEIFHGKLIKLRVVTIPQPSGGTTRFEIVEHPDAVAIVALRYDSLNGSDVEPFVLFVNQERLAIQKQTWELPAGLVELNERDTPELAAARELRSCDDLPSKQAVAGSVTSCDTSSSIDAHHGCL